MDKEERKAKLEALVTERGMDVKTLAGATSLHENTIRNALAGKNMTIETLQKLAKALNVHPSVLI